MAQESHDNLLLQADWDDSALVSAFERHYNQYHEYHSHGSSGRPKKIARTQSNLHIHNPRPSKVQPECVTAENEADEEGEIEEIVNEMEQAEEDEREQGGEEEEGAIVDEEMPSQKCIDEISYKHDPEQTIADQSATLSDPVMIHSSNGSTIPTPPLPTNNPELCNLLLSWYYAGYYTGRHDAHQISNKPNTNQ